MVDAVGRFQAHDVTASTGADAVTPTRVVLGTMPPLLGDIVRETLARHEDVEVLADVETPSEVAAAVDRTSADVAVLGMSASGARDTTVLMQSLLTNHPRLTVIALASDGRSGYVCQLEPRTIAIDDISPSALVDAIRSNAIAGVHPRLHPFSAD